MELGARQECQQVVGLEPDRLAEVLERLVWLVVSAVRSAALVEEVSLCWVELDRLRQVGDGMLIVAARGRGTAPPREARRVQLSLRGRLAAGACSRSAAGLGGTRHTWLCSAPGGRSDRRQIEHRAAVVGEVKLVLAVRGQDVVGEKEVRSDQHVDPELPQLPD